MKSNLCKNGRMSQGYGDASEIFMAMDGGFDLKFWQIDW